MMGAMTDGERDWYQEGRKIGVEILDDVAPGWQANKVATNMIGYVAGARAAELLDWNKPMDDEMRTHLHEIKRGVMDEIRARGGRPV